MNPNKMIKRFALFFLAAVSTMSVFANDVETIVDEHDELSNDFRMRFEVAADWKPVKNLTLNLAQEVRIKNNASALDRLYTTLDISYKVYKYIKVGASYSFHALYKGDNAWQYRHRGRLHVTGSYSVGDWGLSLRVMPEMTYTVKEINVLEEVNPAWIMRSRFKVDYSFINKPVKPYLYVEMFNPLVNPTYGNAWLEKMRYAIGTEWSVDAHNKFDFYYLLEHDMGQDISAQLPTITRTQGNQLNHIIGIKYKFVF
jgi:hypothetical protein